jgi:transcriptional regulator with XRE-family HTH domain
MNVMHTNVSACGILRHVETVAQRLDRLMKMQGWKAATLAKRAKLGTNTVQKILERGGGAHGETLSKIAQVTGATIDWLQNGSGLPPPTVPPGGLPEAEPADALAGERAVSTTDSTHRPTSSLADALDDAFDRRGHGHSLADSQAVLAVLGPNFRFDNRGDPVAEGRAWLDAARNLRQRKEEITAGALIQEFLYGRRRRAGDGLTSAAASASSADHETAVVGAPSDRPVAGTEGMASQVTGPEAGSGIHAPPANAEEMRAKLGLKARGAK